MNVTLHRMNRAEKDNNFINSEAHMAGVVSSHLQKALNYTLNFKVLLENAGKRKTNRWCFIATVFNFPFAEHGINKFGIKVSCIGGALRDP